MIPTINLTRRQQQVLEALAAHGTYKGGARALSIAPSTFNDYLKAIYARLGVNNAVRAVVVAFEKGLL